MTVRPCGGQKMGICEVGGDGKPLGGKLKPVMFAFNPRAEAPRGTVVVETSQNAANTLNQAIGTTPQAPNNPYFRPV